MDKKLLFKTYAEMSYATLLSIIDREYDFALKVELNIVDDWIKCQRCKCSENPLIQQGKISLDCEHINKVIRKKVEPFHEKLSFKVKILAMRNLAKHYSFSSIREGEQ